MPRTKFLVAWVYLIQPTLVDQEVAIHGDHSNHWTIVDDLLLDSFFPRGNTVVSDFVALALLDRFLALLRSLRLRRITIAAFLYKAIDFGIV